MLWSLLKVLVFVAIIAALTLGAGYLMEMGGGAVVNMGGTEFSLSPLQIILGLVLLLVALWVFLKLLSLLVAVLNFINGDETALSRLLLKKPRTQRVSSFVGRDDGTGLWRRIRGNEQSGEGGEISR